MDSHESVHLLEGMILEWCANHSMPFKRIEFKLDCYREEGGCLTLESSEWCGEMWQKYSKDKERGNQDTDAAA